MRTLLNLESLLHAENHQQISEKVMETGLNPEEHHM